MIHEHVSYIGQFKKMSNVPESPATRIFNLPIFFPRSVNGLREGILIVGIMNCGACIEEAMESSSLDNFELSVTLDSFWFAAKASFEDKLGVLGNDPGEISPGDKFRKCKYFLIFFILLIYEPDKKTQEKGFRYKKLAIG